MIGSRRWLDKEDIYKDMYVYDGILFSHKKEWNLAIYNKIDRARECNAEQKESIRERQNTVWFHTYVEFKKQNKQSQKKGAGRG